MGKNIGIIGGGACGCMTAILLKIKDNNNEVTIFESTDKLLRKVSVSGNGRCNISNTSNDYEDKYFNYDFAKEILNEFNSKKALDVFFSLGLLTTSLGDLVYPLTFQSKSVVNLLKMHIEKLKIKVDYHSNIDNIIKQKNKYIIKDNEFDCVVITCGTNAGNCKENSFDLLKNIKVHTENFSPCLVPIKCDKKDIKGISGLRVKAMATLGDYSEFGEVQFKDGSVSGIVIFNLSRHFDEKTKDLKLDFFEKYSEEELVEMLYNRKNAFKKSSLNEYFTGLLDGNLSKLILKNIALKGEISCDNLKKEDVYSIANQMKNFKIRLICKEEMCNAQVARGGIITSQLSKKLEFINNKNMFAGGEIVNVDGACGGFNLQWAWSCAMTIAEKI